MTAPALKHTTVTAEEFFCPSCLATVQAALSDLAGVISVEVVFPPGRLVVTHDPQRVSMDELIATAAEINSAAHPLAS